MASFSSVLLPLLFALAPSPAAPPTAAPPLDKVIARIQERYDSAADYRAKFTQKYTYAATGRERVSTGQVLIKKPGKMRWNYEQPEPSLWLATGSTFWMYEPEAKQAFKQDLKASQLPAAVAFLMGKGKLSDEFDVAIAKELPYGKPEDHRLSLKPKKPQSTYRSIYFVVDPKTFLVRESVLINAQGDINAISFSDVVLNSKLGDEAFVWSPPAGTRVIDGAALAKASKPADPGPGEYFVPKPGQAPAGKPGAAPAKGTPPAGKAPTPAAAKAPAPAASKPAPAKPAAAKPAAGAGGAANPSK